MNKSPCKDCAERHTACHDTCEKYNNFKVENNKIKTARYEKYREECYAFESVARHKHRN